MDSILEFLRNQQFAVIAALVVPWIYKYVPAFKDYSNGLCTFLAALTAWCVNVFGPQPANAAFLGGILAPAGNIFIPGLEALFVKLLHDHIFNPAFKAVGINKPTPSAPLKQDNS